ncbi:SRPBCC family protein [soil metagenome]
MTERSITHATFVVEKTYDAAPERVYSAWSRPEARERWFFHVGEWPVAEAQHDFREGGNEIGRFQPEAGGPIYINDARYYDIAPGERVLFAYQMYENGKRLSVSVTTVEFKAEGSGTRLVLTEQGAYFDGDDPEGRKAGWTELTERLEREI